jgi:2,4-dienoyl-CoA reductase (NADPH2)
VLKGQEKYPHVFQPIRVGSFTSKNSMKFAACSVSNYCSREGFLTEREYHRMIEIAGCGAGIITNQGAYPDPEAKEKGISDRQLYLTINLSRGLGG